jgi:hypothetical protein
MSIFLPTEVSLENPCHRVVDVRTHPHFSTMNILTRETSLTFELSETDLEELWHYLDALQHQLFEMIGVT